MAVDIFKILRSTVLGNRPTGAIATAGAPYVNFPEKQFGIVDGSNVPQDLIGVPLFSTSATYTTGAPVNNGGKLYVALTAISAGAFNAAQWGLVPAIGSTITGGFSVAPNNLGTISTGTLTPNPVLGNYQYYTNNGAHTIAAPTSDCAIDILITNGASAGSITFTGFTYATGNTGDAYVLTNGSKFILSIRRINAITTFVNKALQ